MTVRQLARLLQPYDQRCQHASCASPVTGESNFDDGEEGSEVGEEGEEEGDEVRRLHARPLFSSVATRLVGVAHARTRCHHLTERGASRSAQDGEEDSEVAHDSKRRKT